MDDHCIDPHSLPLCIKRSAEEGFIMNVESSKKLIRTTCEGDALKISPHPVRPDLSVFKRALRGEDKLAF